MYKVLRSILFLFDAEKVHHFSMNALKVICSTPLIGLIKNMYDPGCDRNSKLQIPNNSFGLTFKNPVGLAAGFDKNAKYLRELEALGFGFVEIGTVTPLPQGGNPTPRLFRLPKEKALINCMGFNNDGAEEIATRLAIFRRAQSRPEHENSGIKMIIGGNIGKNKSTPNANAHEDYLACFKALHPHVDYFAVNVSSPNTPGLRELQEKESLRKILTVLQAENKQRLHQRPILLKISPDLDFGQVDDVISLAREIQLEGLIVANTTLSRDNPLTSKPIPGSIAGGLSGAPLRTRATALVQYIHERSGIPIIASGGIFSGADAAEKVAAGASLVQLWTGFIYEGPAIVKKINLDLNKS